MNKKLVIFDIDGTLVEPLYPIDALQRFRFAIQRVFGKDIGPITQDTWSNHNFNGMGDRAILWELIKDFHISRDLFLDNLGAIGQHFAEYLEAMEEKKIYGQIADAKKLLDLSIVADHISVGTLTGNLGPSASWKLKNAGYADFAFGIYGHEADVRNELAELLIPKANIYFTTKWEAKDIVIIGDTEKDVQCTRHIGAVSVIVKTGWNIDHTVFEDDPPDLFVDSLMDERVLKLLGLH